MEHMENYFKVIDLFENPLFINYPENHVYCFIFNAIVECVNLGSKEDVIIDFDGINTSEGGICNLFWHLNNCLDSEISSRIRLTNLSVSLCRNILLSYPSYCQNVNEETVQEGWDIDKLFADNPKYKATFDSLMERWKK
jgi:hypothetical protein